MGQGQSYFTEEEIQDLEDCTFLSRTQINRARKNFLKYRQTSDGQKMRKEDFLKIPELQHNPFAPRIAEVFSDDGSGDLSFEDFLDFVSIFSSEATRDVKASYAFRIYDFDQDGFVGLSDIEQTLELITKGELQVHEREKITSQIFGESDLDGDKKLSFVEFDHVLKRSDDFVS